MYYFEDMVIGGGRVDIGTRLFTKEDIARFAKSYDPRPECLEGRVASRWHITAIWMSLMMGRRESESDALRQAAEEAARKGERPAILGPSPGFLDMKWGKPVRAGDTLHYRTEVAEKITLKTRPQWGIVRNRNEAFHEGGERALSFLSQALFERRYPEGTKEAVSDG